MATKCSFFDLTFDNIYRDLLWFPTLSVNHQHTPTPDNVHSSSYTSGGLYDMVKRGLRFCSDANCLNQLEYNSWKLFGWWVVGSYFNSLQLSRNTFAKEKRHAATTTPNKTHRKMQKQKDNQLFAVIRLQFSFDRLFIPPTTKFTPIWYLSYLWKANDWKCKYPFMH